MKRPEPGTTVRLTEPSNRAHHPVSRGGQLEEPESDQPNGHGSKDEPTGGLSAEGIERLSDSANPRWIVSPPGPHHQQADHTEDDAACGDAKTSRSSNPFPGAASTRGQVEAFKK